MGQHVAAVAVVPCERDDLDRLVGKHEEPDPLTVEQRQKLQGEISRTIQTVGDGEECLGLRRKVASSASMDFETSIPIVMTMPPRLK